MACRAAAREIPHLQVRDRIREVDPALVAANPKAVVKKYDDVGRTEAVLEQVSFVTHDALPRSREIGRQGLDNTCAGTMAEAGREFGKAADHMARTVST